MAQGFKGFGASLPGRIRAEPQPVRMLVKNVAQFVGVDATISIGAVARAWPIIAGPISVVLITAHLSPAVQGYYYTFANLLALQVFAQMGMETVLIQFASHEWSKLKLNASREVEGDPEAMRRLASILQYAVRWHVIAAGIAVVGLATMGSVFFSLGNVEDEPAWLGPWITMTFLAGVNIILLPLTAVLEGCNQIKEVYTYRLAVVAISSFTTWATLWAGLGLWVPVCVSSASVAVTVAFLTVRYRKFFVSLLRAATHGLNAALRSEIWPMQWRIGISWISGYFMFSAFTPILFQIKGPEVAGQMGITWSAVSSVTSVASTWIHVRVPRFGMLIADNQFKELDALFWRTTLQACGIAVLLAATVWTLLLLLSFMGLPLAARFLPLWPTFLFLLGAVLLISGMPMASYLRAHKYEPLVVASVVIASFTVIGALVLSRPLGATGAALAFLAGNALGVPWVALIWIRSRKKWHQSGEAV